MKLDKTAKCSDKLFDNVKAYQDGRAAARQQYESRLNSLESAKGSEYYTEEAEKAEKAYSDAVAALRAKYENIIFMWLDEMNEVNSARSFEPITADDQRTLDIVRQRVEQDRKISESELDMLYNSLSDNAMARALFDEYAIKAGVRKDYRGEQPATIDYIRNVIRELTNGARSFIESDENPTVARVIGMRANLYGDNGQKVPRRELFTDKAGMFRELLPSFNPANISTFCECVD